MMNDQATEYWFNLRTEQVEVGKQSLSVDRVGPFSTRQEAENALELLASRSKAWQSEDEREDDGDTVS